MYTKYDNIIIETSSYISEQVAKESFKLQYGDLLFAGSGETKTEIGKSATILRNDAYAGGDIVVLRPKNNIDVRYLGYLSNTQSVVRQKSLNGQGDAVVHIYSKGISQILVVLPSLIEEQQAIAQILSDMDAEIAALEEKQEKYEQLKQGMMQELLTGKTRLI